MMSQPRMTVLVVDDEPLKRTTLQIELRDAGYEVYEAPDAHSALRLLDARAVDVVVTDLRMPGMDGLAFLEEIRSRRPGTYVILMTAYGTVDTAVTAIKRGAYDYLTKPFATETLIDRLDRIRMYRFAESPAALEVHSVGRLIGVSHRMRQLLEQVRLAAAGREAVLISGEPGTGKSLVAETIHQLAHGRAAGLARVNAELLPERSVETELFGGQLPVSGSYRPGRLEQAAGGTLLIENVDRLSRAVQSRLLQALETQAVETATGTVPLTARLISTTRTVLLENVRRGEFREDLYYRLSARSLCVPPLRDRREDIPALAQEFVARHSALARAADGGSVGISAHAMDLLMGYHWPGNVLELEHTIEQALTRAAGEEIGPEHLPGSLSESEDRSATLPLPEVGIGLNHTVAEVERTLIEAALRHSAGNQARAAQLLRIPRTTLRDKMAKYGLVGEPPTV